MSGNWTYRTWGDLATLEYGKGLREYDSTNPVYPVFGTNGQIGWHSSPLRGEAGIVIGRKGAYRGVHYSRKPFFVIDTAFYVKPKENFDLKWAYYQLKDFDINKIDSGSAIPSTSREAFYAIPVSLPPLPVQRKIAAVLSAYDDLIENNTRRIEILEEMAQTLYREWFIYFRFPGHEQSKMATSALGPIPTGWGETTVEQSAKVYRGRSYKGTEVVDEGGVPFISLKSIARDGGFRRDGVKRYIGPFREAQTARAGDIVMAVTDMTQERRIVAHAARIPTLGGEISVFSMDLVKIVPLDHVAPEYLLGMFRFSDFADAVKQHANGANVLHLSPDQISAFRFPLPPQTLRDRYGEISRPIYEMCDGLAMTNDNLRHTRDLLLPKLISGEVAVDDLDIETGEADSPKAEAEGASRAPSA